MDDGIHMGVQPKKAPCLCMDFFGIQAQSGRRFDKSFRKEQLAEFR